MPALLAQCDERFTLERKVRHSNRGPVCQDIIISMCSVDWNVHIRLIYSVIILSIYVFK